MKVFVTVGSTQFDPLVELLNQSSTIQVHQDARHRKSYFFRTHNRLNRKIPSPSFHLFERKKRRLFTRFLPQYMISGERVPKVSFLLIPSLET